MVSKIISGSVRTLPSFASQVINNPSFLKIDICSKLWQGVGKSCIQRTFSSVSRQPKDPTNPSYVYFSTSKPILDALANMDTLKDDHLEKTVETAQLCKQFAAMAVEELGTCKCIPISSYKEAIESLIYQYLIKSLFEKLNSAPSSIFKTGFQASISQEEIRAFIANYVFKIDERYIAHIPHYTISMSPQSCIHMLDDNWKDVKISIVRSN